MIVLKEQKTIIVLILVILGLFLRIYGVADEGISLDESYSIHNAEGSLGHIVTLDDPSPFLYLLLIKPFAGLSDGNIFFSRLPFMILGALSIFLIYLLGKKIFDGKVGLISALILTFSPYHIYYSQEARTYSLLFFSCLLSLYFFLKLLDEDTKKNYLYYFLSTSILLYAHIFAVFVVLVQNIYFIYVHHSSKKFNLIRWFSSQAALLMLYVPAILNIYSYLQKTSLWLTPQFLFDMLYILGLFSGGKYLSIILSGLFIFGSYLLFRKRRPETVKEKEHHPYLLMMLIVTPLVIPLTYSLLFSPIILPKYVIFVMIPFILILSFGLSRLDKRICYGVLLVIILLSSIHTYQQAESVEKDVWVSVDGIINDLKDFDSIIINPGYNLLPFLYYHDPVCFSDSDIYGCASRKNIYTLWGKSEKEKNFTGSDDNIIYITKRSMGVDDDNYLTYLKQNYSVIGVHDLKESKYSEILIYDLVRD